MYGHYVAVQDLYHFLSHVDEKVQDAFLSYSHSQTVLLIKSQLLVLPLQPQIIGQARWILFQPGLQILNDKFPHIHLIWDAHRSYLLD